MPHRAHRDRDWSQILLNIKWARQRAVGHCTRLELAQFCGIPLSTMHNLYNSSVLQPLHSTGERILAAERLCFPNEKEH